VEKIMNPIMEILKIRKNVCKKWTRREVGFWCLHKIEKTYIVFDGGTDAHTTHNSLYELHGQYR
jgi:hypothetical protein